MIKNYTQSLFIVILMVFTLPSVYSQTVYDWLDFAPDNNWRQGASGARWSGGLYDEPPFGTLQFNNNHELTMVNNVGGGYSFHKMIFGSSNTSNRTISGNDLFFFDFSGIDPEIENISTGSHTINCNITGDNDGDPLLIDAQSGNITLNGTINNNGSYIDAMGNGGHNITINGIISGAGGLALKDNTNLILTGSNIYSGDTVLEGGILKIQGNILNSTIIVKSGATLEIDGDITVKSIQVDAGGYVQVNSGMTLTVTNNLTLNSVSNLYSSLISHGTIIGTVNYNRYVNTYNSTTGSSTGQNDLISAPVANASQTFGAFRATNSNIPSGTVDGTTMYLFGPFDNNNASAPYTLYSASDDSEVITAGTGYRTGSVDASTFTFVGDVETGTVPVNISMGSAYNWNLIGNPYASYINSGDFLTENAAYLDEDAVGIYGYDGSAQDGWIILNYNTMNTAENLAPGQGFMVAAEGTSTLNFTPSMRRVSGGDDFIDGRASDENLHLRLQLEKMNTSCHTDFYFNSNSTRALDPGYDAKLFNGVVPNFYLYSHLIENNEGQNMAIQSLHSNDLTDVTIPLGVNVNQGEQLTFSISETSLPNSVEVYLEDTVANTSKLLNTGDYILTPNVDLNDTGRFYLRVSNSTLSTVDNSLDQLNIYTNKADKTIVVAGQLLELEPTTASVYDVQGRLVSTTLLQTTLRSQAIDVSQLNDGVYVVKLQNAAQNKTQKVIIY